METTARKVTEFAVTDHGVEYEQYFQGAGVARTRFEGCAVGIGESAHAAMEDALDSLAQQGWDVGSIPNEESAEGDVPEDSDGLWHYVSVRVR